MAKTKEFWYKQLESAGCLDYMKKKFKKILVITCIIICIIFVLIVIFLIIGFKRFLYGEEDITDIPCSIAVNISVSNPPASDNSESEQRADLRWYETLEEALQDDELIKGEAEIAAYKESDAVELVQIQTVDKLIVFYSRAPQERIYCVLLETGDGNFSQPYKMYIYRNRPGDPGILGESDYSYDCDDGMVFYIEREAVLRNIIGEGQDQIPVCFGMWANKAELESVTVAGQAPKIIPVVFEEDTRYFWYFENVDWLDRLGAINWGNYTYRQIIDVLEIKYDKAEED